MNWNNGTLQTPHLRIQITKGHIDAKGIWCTKQSHQRRSPNCRS